MKIAILGAGAMGCLVGAHLKAGGASVHLIDVNKEHMAVIEQDGLHMEIEAEPGRDPYSRVIRFDSASVDSRGVGTCDAVIVLVKCQATHAAIGGNPFLFGEKTAVVTLQNGVGGEELLREHFMDENIGFGLMKASALQYAPGRIYGRPRFPESPKGIYYRPLKMDSPILENFLAIETYLNAGGMPAQCAENTEEIVWGKLFNNCIFNAIGALLRLPNEVSSTHPDGLALMEKIGREVCLVGSAKGFDMEPEAFWRAHGGPVERAPGGRLHFVSSVLDSYRKNMTEIDFINGAVVRAGKKYGIDCPYNEAVWRLVRLMQDTYHEQYDPAEDRN